MTHAAKPVDLCRPPLRLSLRHRLIHQHQHPRSIIPHLNGNVGGRIQPAQQPGRHFGFERIGQGDPAAQGARRGAVGGGRHGQRAQLALDAVDGVFQGGGGFFEVQAVTAQHQQRLHGTQLGQQLVAVHLHVLERFDRGAHGTGFGQRALGGLHEGRQAVEGFAAGQTPFQFGGDFDGLELFRVQCQFGVADLGIDGAPHHGRDLAAFPGGQDVAVDPGDGGADEGVGHALE